MADVFVSYSRRDAGFVRRLSDAISKLGGRDVWLDTEGIQDGEVFPEAIKRAIEQSDTFVFVITPNAVNSAYCENEVEYARQMQKRILPVLREQVRDADLPDEIRDRSWIPFTVDADFEQGMARLAAALDTDLEATKAHTRWLVKALEWNSERRDKSFLLRGSELRAAEEWLAASPEDADPAPTSLQREYLLASRDAFARRQRSFMGVSLAVAALSIGLLIFALISRGQAVSERVSARSQALSAESQAQLPNDPEISLLLGMRAVRTHATPQSMFALRAALDASPLEVGFPSVDVPRPCSQVELGLTATYSPDGREVAEAVCSGTVRLLHPGNGRLLRTVRVGRGASSVAYSPDGALLAVGAGPGVTLLNPRTGAIVHRLQGVHSAHSGQTLSVVFSRSGRMLAATSPAGLTVWSLPGGQPRRLALAQFQGFSLAFSPDGRRLYTGGMDGFVRVYDVATGRESHRIDPFPANRGQSWPLVVAVSPDGGRLAVAYPGGPGGAGFVSLYSTSTWRKQFDVTSIPDVEVQSVAFSPDGRSLAVGAEDGTAGVWSLIARQQVAAYDGPTAAVNSVSFSPDGRRVVTASDDGFTRVWRAVGTEQSFIPLLGNVGQIALHGAVLETLLASHAPLGLSVNWSRLPGGQTFDRVTLIRDPSAGFASLSGDGRFALVWRFLTSPNGPNPQVAETIVDARTGRVVRRLGSVPAVVSGPPTFSPDDGKLIFEELPSTKTVAGSGDAGPGGTGGARLEVLTLATGRFVSIRGAEPCGPGAVAKWAFSGDGTRVAQAAFCGIADVWDTRTGRLLRQVDAGAETSAVALNHDGSRLLVSSWDSRAAIWNVATGKRLVNFIGHTRGIADAALSPDGTRVITGSLDRTLRVWDARTGQILRVLTFPDAATPVSFSADGSQFAVVDTTPIIGVPNIVRVFDTCPACQDPRALLRSADSHATTNLTQLESSVVSGS
jgi:WD40 repeat protein